MADALVAAVLAHADQVPDQSRTRDGLEIGLVVTDTALFGQSEDPAHLTRCGPVPAELAREIIAGACSTGEQLWLRRLYTHPTTGEPTAMDSRSRRFRGSLARLVRLRDRVCRTPWCTAPVRQADHAHDHATGGPTSAENAQGLCEACNRAKQALGWRASLLPGIDGHAIETRMPTGHTYRSHAPPLARVHHLPPLTIDHVLAG